MRWYDIVVLLLVLGYCAYVLLRKKKGGCSGNCANCKGCAHSKKKNKKRTCFATRPFCVIFVRWFDMQNHFLALPVYICWGWEN